MTKLSSRLLTTVAVTLAASALVACGGGGGSSPSTVTAVVPPPPPPPTSQAPSVPSFVANQFPPSSDLEALCQVVRTDTDLNGNARPDQQGELLHELFWLRSWMNETYLFLSLIHI